LSCLWHPGCVRGVDITSSQAREAKIDFDTDDEVLIKKDGAKIERSDQQTAASSLDMASMFQMEDEVRRLCPLCCCFVATSFR
jgi:hypothetical protein